MTSFEKIMEMATIAQAAGLETENEEFFDSPFKQVFEVGNPKNRVITCVVCGKQRPAKKYKGVEKYCSYSCRNKVTKRKKK